MRQLPSGNWNSTVRVNGKSVSVTMPTPELLNGRVKELREYNKQLKRVKCETQISPTGNYTVYQHIFPNGKSYVGITGEAVSRRWREGKGYKNQKLMWDAIQEFGWDNIQHRILFENLTVEEACVYEKCLVKLLDLTDRDNGYNYIGGGEIKANHSKPTIRLEDGKEYASATEAAKDIMTEPKFVHDVCAGKKFQVDGWSFMYKKDFELLPSEEKSKYKWWAKYNY